MAITREIIRKEGLGLNGLNKGLTATLLRNGIFNGFYFGFYHSVKSYIPQSKDPVTEFLTKVIKTQHLVYIIAYFEILQL